jgi:hypothetical protein
MTSASQHLVALIWAVLLGLVFLGGIGWWWVNARRRRHRTPDLGILTALHQEREPERSVVAIDLAVERGPDSASPTRVPTAREGVLRRG